MRRSAYAPRLSIIWPNTARSLAVLKMPAPVGLQTYGVRVADGWVEVEVE